MNTLLLAALLTAGPGPFEAWEAPKPRQVPIVIVNLALGQLATNFVHESGHALAASIASDVRIVTFRPFPGMCGGQFSSGCFELDPTSSRSQIDFVVRPAGMLATRFAAEGYDALGNLELTGPRSDQFLAAFYLTARIDAFQYVLRSAIMSWSGNPPPRSWDPQGIVSGVRQDRAGQNWMYAGLLTLLVVDLILDWDEIKTNWNRLWI